MSHKMWVFNKKWLITYPWLIDHENKHKAACKHCKKVIDISSMGESALKSHAKSEKHKKNLPETSSLSLTMFVSGASCPSVPSSQQSKLTTGPSVQTPQQTPITNDVPTYDFAIPPPPLPTGPPTNNNVKGFPNKNTILKSEVLWTLQTVVTHCSYKSNENISDVFKAMFPDSEIAQRFKCGERKTSYMCVFGLADYFKQTVLGEVKGHFVLLFDESLNKKMQEKQLDIHVRYWESMQQAVVPRPPLLRTP